jgi:predicted esterase
MVSPLGSSGQAPASCLGWRMSIPPQVARDLAPAGQTGSPRIFVSHGTQDGWLPIDSCSRRIVPQLERAGYEVRYREFEGGHVVPPGIAREAATWFANRY